PRHARLVGSEQVSRQQSARSTSTNREERRRFMTTGGRSTGRARGATAIAAAGLTLALGVPGHALASPAKCRQTIATSMSKAVKRGYKNVAKWQKTEDKAPGAVTGGCKDVPSATFDPKGTYGKAKTAASTLIGAQCTGETAVNANYDGNNPSTTVGQDVDD